MRSLARWGTVAVYGMVMVLMSAVLPVFAAGGNTGLQGQWHRDNSPTSHEMLACTGSSTLVHCRYQQVPEPLNDDLSGDPTTGHFYGEIIEADDCPQMLKDDGVCDAEGVAVIVAGTTEYTSGWVVDEVLVAYDDGFMLLYWDSRPWNPSADGFYCPWYDSYQRALDNDPACTTD